MKRIIAGRCACWRISLGIRCRRRLPRCGFGRSCGRSAALGSRGRRRDRPKADVGIAVSLSLADIESTTLNEESPVRRCLQFTPALRLLRLYGLGTLCAELARNGLHSPISIARCWVGAAVFSYSHPSQEREGWGTPRSFDERAACAHRKREMGVGAAVFSYSHPSQRARKMRTLVSLVEWAPVQVAIEAAVILTRGGRFGVGLGEWREGRSVRWGGGVGGKADSGACCGGSRRLLSSG